MNCAVYNIAHQSGSRILYVHHSTALPSTHNTFLSLIFIDNLVLFKPWILTKNNIMFKGRLSWTQYNYCSRSRRPPGARRTSAAARLLKLWVRIPPGAWMSLCCECCVLPCRGLCDELITRPEESYRLWCVVECDLGTSWMRRPWPTGGGGGGCSAKNKQIIIVTVFLFTPPWRWPQEWPKHVCDYSVIKLHSYIEVRLLVFPKTTIPAAVDSSFVIILSFSLSNKCSRWTVCQKQ